MRIVVAGAQGQVARSLAECGSQNAAEVIAIGRPELDLTKPESVPSILKAAAPDVIVNAAAYTAVDAAEQHQAAAYEVNAGGAAVLAYCAGDLGIPLIHVSTDYVFDGEKSAPYTEEDRTSPLGHYGQTKAAGEQAVLEATDNHVILRTAWIFSPFERNFVKTMLDLAGRQPSIRVVADQYGSPTYALHLAGAIISIAGQLVAKPTDRRLRGIFHIANQGYASWAEFANAIFDDSRMLSGSVAEVIPIPTADYPTLARRPGNSRLDCSKISRVYGIVLPHWRSAVEICVARLLNECEEQATT